ncbi:glycosyltransferase family 4 protein [Cellulosimicrobium marinum]|uniref:glycosyltransferase family 4 protein n=1 Tax=Cellulosimicrobium marinum TaxID=1638992 RepID=UPI001E2BFC11|nr:glycosyltransferase family 4 protein [Cellulosimicrobium marinum]MCB7137044.1 glycosyltransferase family 4 protein [Cellulosimicrobium marinum]
MSTPTTFVLPADEPFGRVGSGAVATVTAHLAQGLVARGREVAVVSSRVRGAPLADVALTTTPWSASPSPVTRAARRLRRLARRGPADPFDTYRAQVVASAPAGTVVVHNDARLAAKLARHDRRVVLWLHNLVVDDAVADAGATCRMVAVSDYVRRWTAERHGVPLDRIDVVPNGVDVAAFRPREGERRPGPLRVVVHARIDPNKGQVVAARAVAALRARGVPVELTVAGALRTFGMDADRVRAYQDELRTALDRAGATYVGEVPHADMPRLLREQDVALALTAVPEPFSLAALEAMASGCAVVAVPSGGLAEVVGDCARLVDLGTEPVADALAGLERDPALRADLARRARERAETFSWSASVGALVDVLDATPRPA